MMIAAQDFARLGLSDWLIQQCHSVGFKSPTPVQEHCIPSILQGKDCIGCAKTGSGKTGAFALPILHTLSKDPYGVYALVLTPTRELAYQISEQFHVLGKHINLITEVIVGGVDMMKQAMGLSRQPHVVIATPGRLADHLQSTDTVSLQRVKYLVLDEADRLLEPCFEDDLSVILDSLPSKRQTLIFSATLTDCLLRLRNLATGGPFFWQDNSDVATVETLDQRYILMPAQLEIIELCLKIKDCYLIALLEQIHDVDKKTLIIFTDTCRNCQVYGSLLKYLEFPCVTLHSLMTQRQRLGSLTSFKSGQIKILVATDVASRGLDIPKVGVVVNLNVPALSKDYIHRVGRTARAGQGGMAITMMTQYDVTRVKNIESDIKIQMTKYDIDEKEALKNLTSVAIAKKEIQLTLGESEFGKKRKINLLKRNSHQIKHVKNLKQRKRH